MKLRKPLDIERWGKREAWDYLDIPDIIAGVEPDRDPNAAWPIVAEEFLKTMTSACIVGILRPIMKTSSGEAYFLASQVVELAKDKDFSLPTGLEARVKATAAAGLVRILEEKLAESETMLTGLRLATAPQPGGLEEAGGESRGDVRVQLWKLADDIAASVRNEGVPVSLNAVCKELCKQTARNANKALLHGQKGWHTESWLKKDGHLKGWKDPMLRK